MLVRENIPLVDDNDTALAGLVSITCNFLILLGDTDGSLNQHQNNISTVNRPQRTNYAVTLHRFINLVLSPHTGSINQGELDPVLDELCVDSIAGGAWNITDNDSLLTKHSVD